MWGWAAFGGGGCAGGVWAWCGWLGGFVCVRVCFVWVCNVLVFGSLFLLVWSWLFAFCVLFVAWEGC